MSAETEKDIRDVCNSLAEFLIAKNRAYGDSATMPHKFLGRTIKPVDAIDVRISDKINRITDGHEHEGDDTLRDLLGYLVLREVLLLRTDT